MTSFERRRISRLLRLAIVGGAVAAAGLVAPFATLADDTTFDPPTQNERSITMIESKEPSGDTAFVPLSPNQRSILLIESKEAPGGQLAGSAPETVPYGNR